jgi:hypothetical protein
VSLCQSATLTPARLAANRRHALKSTGPRTTRGKVQARLNGLRRGEGARLYHDVMMLLMETPPGQREHTLGIILTPQEARSRLFRGLVSMIHEAEIALIRALRKAHGFGEIPGGKVLDVRSGNVLENIGGRLEPAVMLLKNNDVSHFVGLGY